MRELSLHVLDLVTNSIEAGADKVELSIVENSTDDRLIIRVTDNGRGIEPELLQKILDPFVTSRKTRRIGLGLPLIEMSTNRCDGYLKVESQVGSGTSVEAMYKYSHIDRPPLGDIKATIKTIIIANPELDFRYAHKVAGHCFHLATQDLKEVLGEVPLSSPEVIEWLENYINDGINKLYGGV
ncbi:ATP-binding protein [Dendrosporobacter sp. 1207_IL3150]|uniref:ATP-binding protein n=1 Tax=Dendrosporobacter sp. 1207_IL3150 TaxID=3084054 RepID=UPI002FDB5C33